MQWWLRINHVSNCLVEFIIVKKIYWFVWLLFNTLNALHSILIRRFSFAASNHAHYLERKNGALHIFRHKFQKNNVQSQHKQLTFIFFLLLNVLFLLLFCVFVATKKNTPLHIFRRHNKYIASILKSNWQNTGQYLPIQSNKSLPAFENHISQSV